MTSSNPLISIIVPIYNAELYLEACLSSIASQTYKNIEVILVNDGSKDNSGNISEIFCEKDTRFQLINQVNRGVGAARNTGLKIAQGEFLIHADSDDLMSERAIEYLYRSILDNGSDIAIGAYTQQTHSGDVLIKHYTSDKHAFTQKLLTGEYHSGLWNKLIKMNLCKQHEFVEDINFLEDRLFLVKVLKRNDIKISIINENVYYYRLVATSYVNNMSYDSMLSAIKAIDQVCNISQDMFSDKLLAHIKNKHKSSVLLGFKVTQRYRNPESIKYLLDDQELLPIHKIVIILDLLHMNYFIDFYRYLGKQKRAINKKARNL